MRNTILRYHYVAMREKYSQDYHLLYYYKSTLKNIKKIYRGQQTDRKLLCISYSTCSYWSTNSSSYNWKPKSSWYSDYAWFLHTLITTLISLVSQQISFLSFYLTNIDCIPKKDGWNQFLLLPIGMVLNYICMLIWTTSTITFYDLSTIDY